MRKTKEFKIIFRFFSWFRNNGEKHLGGSIENMIEQYLKEKSE